MRSFKIMKFYANLKRLWFFFNLNFFFFFRFFFVGFEFYVLRFTKVYVYELNLWYLKKKERNEFKI